jgi:aspartyl-tRNA(Asn)/glutamyl-tRNA(Gln) amidotransferase subunit A
VSETSIVDAMADVGNAEYPWLEVSGRTTCVFNLTGMPALTLPCGFNDQGLPIGIQFAAAPYKESVCLRIGHTYQQLTKHHLASPSLIQHAD